MNSLIPRRRFIELSAAWTATSLALYGAAPRRHASLPDVIGINTVNFSRQQRATDARQRIDPYDIPQLVRDELDVKVLDLVSTMLNTREHDPLEKFRARAERAGCTITNLKINLPLLRYDSEDAATRRHA